MKEELPNPEIPPRMIDMVKQEPRLFPEMVLTLTESIAMQVHADRLRIMSFCRDALVEAIQANKNTENVSYLWQVAS